MILITGAHGFVGKNLVHWLVAHGQASNIRLFLRSPSPEYEDIACCYGDIANQQQISDALKDINTVIHLASKNIDKDCTGFEQTNVIGVQHLTQGCVQQKVRKLIYLSSTGVYGHSRHLSGISEGYPIRPDTKLSLSKAAAEEIIINYHRQGKFQAVILRPRFIYGQYDVYFIPSLMRHMSKNPVLVNGGKAKVSVIHVDDLVSVVAKFARDDFQFQDDYPVFHVNDANPVAYKEISQILAQQFNYSAPKIAIPSWLLYAPIKFKELCVGEKGVTSLQIKLLTYDNYFSTQKLQRIFPGFKCAPFSQRFSVDDYPECRGNTP